MKKLVAMAVVVLTAACGVDKGEPFRSGFPYSDTVKLNVPGSQKALSGPGTRQDGLEGQTATFYSFTRGITVVVNGAAGVILTLVEKIVENPPSSVTGNVAVWGPHTDPLSPNTWRFTVTKTGAADFSYVLEGKGKTEADTAYRAVLSGNHTSTAKHFGHGSFLLDWDKAAQLPEHDANNVGTAEFTYSHDTSADPVSIKAVFTNVKDKDSGQIVSASYQYGATAGHGGTFDFTMAKDFVPGAGIEDLTVRSRWQEDGTGRSDVKGSGGDLASPATVNECWDSNFLSRYFTVSFDATQNYGQQTVCAFATAEYSTL